MGKKKKCRDHTGAEYNSIKEMCDHWGVTYRYFDKRRSRGMNLEDCLTFHRGISCTDHLGNSFTSKKDMCHYWNRTVTLYNYRINVGCTVEEALTGDYKPHGSSIPCKDHPGNSFPSKEARARHWHVSGAYGGGLVANRLRRDWTLQEALTKRLGFSTQESPTSMSMGRKWGRVHEIDSIN